MTEGKDLQGVGGWLSWLIFIMCVLGPLLTLGSFTGEIARTEATNEFLTAEPGWAYYKQLTSVLLGVAVGVMILGGALLGMRLKRSSVHFAIASLWVADVGIVLGDFAILTHALPEVAEVVPLEDVMRALFPATITAGIWTLYLLRSRRVKNTYVSTAADVRATYFTSPGAETPPSSSRAVIPSARIAEIERLQALLERGALTQEEFGREKTRVLRE